MKNIPRSFILFAVLLLALMPAQKATGQTQNPQSPPDELSVKQARRDIVSASKFAGVWKPSHIMLYILDVNSSSIVFTLDSIEFDTTYTEATKKIGTKHFLIGLKDINKLTSKCPANSSWCSLATESGTEYMIQDKEAVRYYLHFHSAGDCNGMENNAECMQPVARFARDLNRLHAFAISHAAGLGDFHAQATTWRALATKPALAEGARILRLAAEDAFKRQKPDEALNDFELGVEADPTWAQGWFNAALLAGELGFFSDAVEHMQNYLELLPNATDAQSAREQIDLWKYKAGQPPAVAQPAGAPNKK